MLYEVITMLGLITGISASLSMGASEYLSKKQEKEDRAFSSSLYTGIAYIITVSLLIAVITSYSIHYTKLSDQSSLAHTQDQPCNRDNSGPGYIFHLYSDQKSEMNSRI